MEKIELFSRGENIGLHLEQAIYELVAMISFCIHFKLRVNYEGIEETILTGEQLKPYVENTQASYPIDHDFMNRIRDWLKERDTIYTGYAIPSIDEDIYRRLVYIHDETRKYNYALNNDFIDQLRNCSGNLSR